MFILNPAVKPTDFQSHQSHGPVPASLEQATRATHQWHDAETSLDKRSLWMFLDVSGWDVGEDWVICECLDDVRTN